MALTPHARQIISAIYATRVGRGVHGGYTFPTRHADISHQFHFSPYKLSTRYLNAVKQRVDCRRVFIRCCELVAGRVSSYIVKLLSPNTQSLGKKNNKIKFNYSRRQKTR